MRYLRSRAWAVFLVTGLLLAMWRSVGASPIGGGEITLSNLQITPTAGVLHIQVWTAEAFAEVSNFQGALVQDFDTSVGGVAQAEAIIPDTDAHATASAVDVTARAAGHSTGGGRFEAFGTLFTFFELTGGQGTVNVAFFMDIDTFGAAETSATLELDGMPILFHQGQLAGPASTHLMTTLPLTFGQEYTLVADVGAEPLPRPRTVDSHLAAHRGRRAHGLSAEAPGWHLGAGPVRGSLLPRTSTARIRSAQRTLSRSQPTVQPRIRTPLTNQAKEGWSDAYEARYLLGVLSRGTAPCCTAHVKPRPGHRDRRWPS